MGARICGYHLSRHPYEEGQWRFIARFLKPGMNFFDIGANQGFYTLLAAKQVGPQGRVFAFEPAPNECEKLKSNLSVNRFSNVVVEQAAVGSCDGYTEFWACLDGQGSFSSCRPPGENLCKARTEVIRVPLIALDRYVRENQVTALDFIKIDVEGGERDVINGASNSLASLRPVLMCELTDIATRSWGYCAAEIYQLLVNYDYHCYRTTPEGMLKFAEVKEKYDPDWENLIAVPEEKRDRLSPLIREA